VALSGDKLVATATASSRVDTDGSTTSTSYTATLSGSSVPGVAFVAPPSGKVTILFAAATYNSVLGNDNKIAVQVRAGGSVGSGTVFYAANDNDMILWRPYNALAAHRASSFAEVTGLTPGDTYNAQMMVKTVSGTANFLYKFIKVLPDV
jgi:hypothetical protein